MVQGVLVEGLVHAGTSVGAVGFVFWALERQTGQSQETAPWDRALPRDNAGTGHLCPPGEIGSTESDPWACGLPNKNSSGIPNQEKTCSRNFWCQHRNPAAQWSLPEPRTLRSRARRSTALSPRIFQIPSKPIQPPLRPPKPPSNIFRDHRNRRRQRVNGEAAAGASFLSRG